MSSLSEHWRSAFGVIRCLRCGIEWPCHLSAWLMPGRHICEICRGQLVWAEQREEDVA